jgi:hypothetical protein
VLRVHTRDQQAAQCSAQLLAQCEAAIVVEAVVWPVVPTEIAGERVYRAADQASFPTSVSFLLGGVVTTPKFIPACPAPPERTDAEMQLIPYCTWIAIDGIHLAPPKGASGLFGPVDEVVVERVHLNDPAGAECPARLKAACESAVVAEKLVWRSGPLNGETPSPAVETPTPGVNLPTANVTEPPPAPTPTTPPTQGTGQLDADGVPVSLDGLTVYRAAALSKAPASSFLLGGRLTRDTTCPAPATPLPKPPGCGYWMIDGVKVGTMVDMNVAAAGQIVVAEVERGRALAVCPGGSCTTDTIVVVKIVWPNLEPPAAAP